MRNPLDEADAEKLKRADILEYLDIDMVKELYKMVNICSHLQNWATCYGFSVT